MKGIFTLVCCLLVGFVFGQVPFRSAVVTGNWNVNGSWEQFIAGSWVPATATPTSANSSAITILSGHAINYTTAANTLIDQTIVESGSTLIISAGTLSVQAGAGVDLQIDGTVQLVNAILRANQVASLIVVNGVMNNNGSVSNTSTTKLQFGPSSIYNHENVTPGIIPSATWMNGSICKIIADVSSAPAGLNQSFYDFEWNTPVLGSDADLNSQLTTVRHNLAITNTGQSFVYLAQGAPLNLTVQNDFTIAANAKFAFTIDGDLSIDITNDFVSSSTSLIGTYGIGNVDLNVGNDVTLASGTFDVAGVDPGQGLSGSGVTTFSITGDYTNTSASIIMSGTSLGSVMQFSGNGPHTFSSTFVPTYPIDYSITGTGNLSVGASSFLAGPGALDVGLGSSLTLLSVDTNGALRNGTAGGNVQVTGARTYTGTIVYGQLRCSTWLYSILERLRQESTTLVAFQCWAVLTFQRDPLHHLILTMASCALKTTPR